MTLRFGGTVIYIQRGSCDKARDIYIIYIGVFLGELKGLNIIMLLTSVMKTFLDL